MSTRTLTSPSGCSKRSPDLIQRFLSSLPGHRRELDRSRQRLDPWDTRLAVRAFRRLVEEALVRILELFLGQPVRIAFFLGHLASSFFEVCSSQCCICFARA